MARTIHTRDERREQFIKAGLKIAKKSGVAKTSVAAVAAECGVTAPLIFHNFGSRKGFHDALTKAAKDQGIALPDAAAPARAPRKRSVAEVKAIKDKVAGKRSVGRSAKDGKFVTKAHVKANPNTTITQKVKAPKAVKKAVAPKSVKRAAAPKAVTKATAPKAVRAPRKPKVSSAFSPMPAPAAPAGDQQ